MGVLRGAVGALGVVWEAPQTLLGLVNLGIELARGGVAHLSREEGRIFVELRGSRAISLGHFVFWSTIDAPIVRVNPDNKRHEYDGFPENWADRLGGVGNRKRARRDEPARLRATPPRAPPARGPCPAWR